MSRGTKAAVGAAQIIQSLLCDVSKDPTSQHHLSLTTHFMQVRHKGAKYLEVANHACTLLL